MSDQKCNISVPDENTRTMETNHWELVIPWFLTIISTAVLVGIAWFLIDNIYWLRNESIVDSNATNLSYRSHTYFLYISSIRRSVGLFSGIALMFLGVGVSFYTIKSQTKLNIGGSEKLTFSLVTASPGIIAMVLGVFLIAHNTSSKDKIPIYDESKEATEFREAAPP